MPVSQNDVEFLAVGEESWLEIVGIVAAGIVLDPIDTHSHKGVFLNVLKRRKASNGPSRGNKSGSWC